MNIFKILSENIGILSKGLLYTLLISVSASILGILIGSIVGITRSIKTKKHSPIWFVQKVLGGYVTFFRGTPIVVQLLLFFYGVFQANLDPFLLGIFVFGLNSGAYVSEMIRAGVLAIAKGQMEAGRSLGLSYAYTMRKIIFPQAFKHALPNLGNELISLIKETSVAGYITVKEITQATKLIVASSYDTMGPYLLLSLVYLILVIGLTSLIKVIERRLRKND